MLKKYSKIKALLLPNKKINYFVFSIIAVGFITGCIFLMLIGQTDKQLVTNSIKEYVTNTSTTSVDVLKNISVINFLYIILLIVFSLSIIGSIFNIVIIYFKSFILGFSISSIILTYNFKGIIIGLLYIIPSQLINLFVIYILGIYSLIFSFKILGQVIYKKDNYIKHYLKKYLLLSIICIILTIISTISESFIFPSLLNIVKSIINFK